MTKEGRFDRAKRLFLKIGLPKKIELGVSQKFYDRRLKEIFRGKLGEKELVEFETWKENNFDQVEEAPKEEVIDYSSMTVDELKAVLDEANIEYTSEDLKADLVKLCEAI